MIRRHVTVLRLSLMATDALAAMAIFVAVSIVRFGPGWPDTWEWVGLPAPVAMAGWGGLWVSVLWLHDLYRFRAHWSISADAAQIVRALVLLALLVFVLLVGLRLPQVSRLFLVGLFVAQLSVALVSRIALRLTFAWLRSRGHLTRNILVVGTSPSAQAFADLIESDRALGLRVIGHLGRGPDVAQAAPPREILGTFEDVEHILHDRVVDEVAICISPDQWSLVEAITRLCAEEGKVVRVASDARSGSMPQLAGASHEHYAGLDIQSLVYGPDREFSLLIKRTLDVLGALVGLAILAPVLAAITAAIWLSDGRPIVFRQRRVGLHGRPFDVLKFRTMVRDAEGQLSSLADRNEVRGPAFKLTHDPRITRVGRVLRRSSLDELPQLVNVLRGDMSLVGPRPPLPGELTGYDIWHRRRLSMKPGVTGLWQVSARRDPDFNRWVSIDLDYIDRWSLWLDLKILVRTLPAMLEGR